MISWSYLVLQAKICALFRFRIVAMILTITNITCTASLIYPYFEMLSVVAFVQLECFAVNFVKPRLHPKPFQRHISKAISWCKMHYFRINSLKVSGNFLPESCFKLMQLQDCKRNFRIRALAMHTSLSWHNGLITPEKETLGTLFRIMTLPECLQ